MEEMSSQDIADMLGALAQRRAETGNSKLAGANIAVQSGPTGGSRFARIVIALPNGQTFTMQVEEVD
jgi:hypothetical protein